MKLPSAKDIMAACAAAGLPRSLDCVRGWTCGRRCPPVWVPVVIAEHEFASKDFEKAKGAFTTFGYRVGELSAELTRRWSARQKQTST